MSDCSAKEALYAFVEQLRNEMGEPSRSYPLRAASLRSWKRPTVLELHAFYTHGFCGAAITGRRTDTIILNTRRSEAERNFDCAHEMIHLSRHRDREISCFQCFESAFPARDGFLEWEANEGAAELLVPYRLLLPLAAEAFPAFRSSRDVARFKLFLAARFGVSGGMVFQRLENLKWEIQQHLSGIPLSEISLCSQRELDSQGRSVLSLNDHQEALRRASAPFRRKSGRPTDTEPGNSLAEETLRKAEQEWLYGFLE